MNKNVYICFLLSFIAGTAITFVLIPVLKRLKFGQTIREEGPKWHKKKSGTPTMGGCGFLLITLIFTFIFTKNQSVRFSVCFAALYGLIGFLDDSIKIFFRRNLGLNEKQKLILQIFVSVLFLTVGQKFGYVTTDVKIPYTGISVDFKWFYIAFMTVYMVGFTNAVNLTDGLDGLAATVTFVVGIFFVFSATVLKSESVYMAASLSGALAGFLVFNFYPAKVFMGDTGSLFLGGICCVLAITMKLELLLIIAGIIYVIEALSVIIQVTYYKKTHKRIFLMTPIHHHFEMLKMKEVSIVCMFASVTVIACIVAAFAVV